MNENCLFLSQSSSHRGAQRTSGSSSQSQRKLAKALQQSPRSASGGKITSISQLWFGTLVLFHTVVQIKLWSSRYVWAPPCNLKVKEAQEESTNSLKYACVVYYLCAQTAYVQNVLEFYFGYFLLDTWNCPMGLILYDCLLLVDFK